MPTPLHSKHLLDYLRKRQIPLSIAQHFCNEIKFQHLQQIQSAILFKMTKEVQFAQYQKKDIAFC